MLYNYSIYYKENKLYRVEYNLYRKETLYKKYLYRKEYKKIMVKQLYRIAIYRIVKRQYNKSNKELSLIYR